MTTKLLPREPTLLPCPRCNGNPEPITYRHVYSPGLAGQDIWLAECNNCLHQIALATYQHDPYLRQIELANEWNLRAAPSVTDREKRLVEALREAHMLYREQKLIGTTQECVNWDNKVKRILGEALAEYE